METSKAENVVEKVEDSKKTVQQQKESEEVVQFSDPLEDDMNVASETMEMPYEETRAETFPMEEDLNAPLGENVYHNTPDDRSFDVSEDLNAPFGDFEMPTENRVEDDLNTPLTDDVSYNDSYDMPEEDLNAPFGDNATIPSREEDLGLNLPDIDSIKEDVSATINNENDDDDIWKF